MPKLLIWAFISLMLSLCMIKPLYCKNSIYYKPEKQVVQQILKVENNQKIIIKNLNLIQKKLDRESFILTTLLSAIFTLIGVILVIIYWGKKKS